MIISIISIQLIYFNQNFVEAAQIHVVCTTGYLPHVHNLLSGSGNNGLNDKNENKSKWNEKIEEQCLHSSRTKKLVMKINDLPHCPQVSTGRLSSSFHFLPRPISLADGNKIINNPWFSNLSLRENNTLVRNSICVSAFLVLPL